MFDWEGRRKYLNGPERQACLVTFNAEQNEASRAFCLTLFHTGCRISEALQLNPKNIDLSHGSIVFETLKRRRQGVFRAVPVPDTLLQLLSGLLSGVAPSSRIWNFSRATAYRLVKERMAQAGVQGTMGCPKGLRHGFAIACIAQSIPLTTVQKWMGHARLETTAIYLGVSGDEERNLAQRLWLHLNSYQKPYQKSGPPKPDTEIFLRDDQWQRVAPCLSRQGAKGRPRADDRRTLDAILYVLVTGCRWRDLPREYGDCMTAWRRLKLWMEDGSLLKAWGHLLGDLRPEELACQETELP